LQFGSSHKCWCIQVLPILQLQLLYILSFLLIFRKYSVIRVYNGSWREEPHHFYVSNSGYHHSSNRVWMREALLIQPYILKYTYITIHQCIFGLKCSNSFHLYLSAMKSKKFTDDNSGQSQWMIIVFTAVKAWLHFSFKITNRLLFITIVHNQLCQTPPKSECHKSYRRCTNFVTWSGGTHSRGKGSMNECVF
jgi:hypothetical protein